MEVGALAAAVADAPVGRSRLNLEYPGKRRWHVLPYCRRLWLVALARIGYKSMEQADVPFVGWQIAVDFAVAVLGEFGKVGIGTAMLAMLLTRPVNMMGGTAMSLYQAMVNRYVIPVIEKHKAEGRAQGLEQGLEQAHEEWIAWNRRRVEAKRQGRDIDESPPRS